MLAALLLGLGVAWLLAGSLARPLRALAGTASRVAGGDLEARARPEGSSEQREVAAAFNDMTGRLGRSLRAQREFVANASHQLRTPLTGLRLRLEAAELKSGDPEVKRELAAAERETERLAAPARPAADPGARARAEDGRAAVARRRGGGGAPALGGARRAAADTSSGWWATTPPAVEASRADVAAMLDNLVENALNYSPAGHHRDDRGRRRRRAGRGWR